MKFLPKTRLITFRVTDQQLVEMDEMLKQGEYANRTEVTREAVASIIANTKSEMRAKQKKKTNFKAYVATIRKEKNLKGCKF